MLELNLQFFGKDGPGGEKTEEPTSKKLNDAREEGQVAKSRELYNAVSLIAAFIVFLRYSVSEWDRTSWISSNGFTEG